jgi:radical SAM superfamily enzyme YgiQ (UPF0313 family)
MQAFEWEADMGGIKNHPKVLLINPPSPDEFIYIRDTNRSGRRSVERTIWPQTSLAMIAGVLQECEVKIIDCIAEGLSYKTVYERMKKFAPSWVITNPISSIFPHDMIICHYAKSLNAKTIIISAHSKALKEEVYGQYPSVDHIISFERGGREIEYLVQELIEGRSTGSALSSLPPARQDLLPTERYSLPFIGRNFTFVVVARGCPYKCIYCRQGVMYEGEVRYRSVDSVIDEIRRYGLRNIALHADTATLNKEWMYEFCKKIPDGVRWICNSRVDTVDPVMLRRMKDAGCWMICYGIESGDDEVLAKNKKGATCEQAKQAVKWTKEAGIRIWGYFMLGLYGDTLGSMQRTIDFACSLRLDIANFAVSAPYPGTEWNSISTKYYNLSADVVFDQNFSATVNQPECPASLVRRMQKLAYLRWFFSMRGLKMFLSNPRFFLHALCDHMRSIFK